MRHDVEWVTAPPLWDLAQSEPGGRPRFRQPALLRFDSDSFMDELIALMQRGDPAIANYVARPETWDKPAAGWAAPGDASLGGTLRLFQPVHGRFYVSTASLVCRRVGLPIRKVSPSAGDRASMVIRRLAPRSSATVDATDPATFTEQAWIGDRKRGVWQDVSSVVADGEERLPLFPMTTTIELGRKRQVWGGLLPVAGREVYEGGAPAAAATPPALPGSVTADPLADLRDPRRASFVARVMQGLRMFLEFPPPTATLESQAANMRESLAFALLDLVDFLDAELHAIWIAVKGESASGLSGGAENVFTRLGVTFLGGTTWRAALRAADAHRPALLGTGTGTGPAPVPSGMTGAQVRAAVTNLISGGHFQNAVFSALDAAPVPAPSTTSSAAVAAAGGAPIAAARAAESSSADGALYWLRFLYERPVCAPFHDAVISEPSRPFRLGPFFDPDAPARPLVIRLPLDTSPKGLRRFPKGVAMLLSTKLRQQMERVPPKLKDLDEGNIPSEPSWSIGMICSLSIPIITLVAFIVLMIFLSLLNIVFWWLAFFKICLPIPVRSE